MRNEQILTAIRLHPKHFSELEAAMDKAKSIANAADLIRAAVKRLSIGEFPNPFPHGDFRRCAWDGGMAAVPDDGEPETLAENVDEPDAGNPTRPEPPPLTRPNWKKVGKKEAIEAWVLDNLGVNLDTRKLTRARMIDEANKLIKAAQAKARKA